MRLPNKLLIGMLLLLAPLRSQELRMSSVELSRGKAGSLAIELVSPGRSQVSALQWDFVFPVSQVNIQDSGWSPGSAAKSAGKQLLCVRQLRKAPETYAYKCILSGGIKTIPNGPVAVVKINIPKEAPTGSAEVRLENVMGSSARATAIEMKPARASVTVR